MAWRSSQRGGSGWEEVSQAGVNHHRGCAFPSQATHPRRVRHGTASHFVTLAVMTKPDLVVRTEARINNHPLCHPLMTIRLVLFDALHTLVKPRAPIFLQYANVFEPHLGRLSPEAIKSSFKTGKFQYLAIVIWSYVFTIARV